MAFTVLDWFLVAAVVVIAVALITLVAINTPAGPAPPSPPPNFPANGTYRIAVDPSLVPVTDARILSANGNNTVSLSLDYSQLWNLKFLTEQVGDPTRAYYSFTSTSLGSVLSAAGTSVGLAPINNEWNDPDQQIQLVTIAGGDGKAIPNRFAIFSVGAQLAFGAVDQSGISTLALQPANWDNTAQYKQQWDIIPM